MNQVLILKCKKKNNHSTRSINNDTINNQMSSIILKTLKFKASDFVHMTSAVLSIPLGINYLALN